MPSRTSKSASSAFPRTVTGRGARNSGVAASGTTAPAEAATSTANNPSATPTSAGAPVAASTHSRMRRISRSSPPKYRAGPRAGSEQTPACTTETQGQKASTASITAMNRRRTVPSSSSSVSAGQRTMTMRSTRSAVIGAVFHSGHLGVVGGRRHRPMVGGEPEVTPVRATRVASPGGRDSQMTAAEIPLARPGAVPPGGPDYQAQVGRLGPAPPTR